MIQIIYVYNALYSQQPTQLTVCIVLVSGKELNLKLEFEAERAVSYTTINICTFIV